MKIKAMQMVLAATIAAVIPSAMGAQQTKQGVQGSSQSIQGMQGSESREKRAETRSESRSEGRQISGRITDVNRRDRTITVDDRQMGKQKLHIGENTRVSRGKESLGWEQLKEGEEVRATATKMGETHHATSVEIER